MFLRKRLLKIKSVSDLLMEMKKINIYTFLLLTLMTVGCISCKPTSEPEETLSMSVASISASATHNSYEVKVTTTSADFTVSVDSAWCVATSNIANKTISVEVSANTIDIIRRAKVTVTAGSKTVQISITQAAGVIIPIILTKTQRDSLALINLNTGITKWNKTQALNTWTGVKVETIDGYRRVTELNIPSANIITAMISDSIKNLTELQYLDLSGNNLSGSIPTLTTLNKLVVIDLKNNKLTGNIPALPTSLAYMSLGQNNLSGTLPTQIKDLTLLMILDLGLNDLTGAIPTEWNSLTKVKYFYLYGNQLSGTIPTYISTFVKMEALALDYNQLTGSIPTGIGNISSLLKLTLQQNKLTGSVPADLISNVNWTSWSATVLPQQNGVTLSGAPAAVTALKLKNEMKNISKSTIYLLPDKRNFY